MDDLIGEFLTETNEGLEKLDMDLVNLEQSPNDKELLGNIFRLIHTIKGTCGFLGLPRLEKVAHHAENVLGRFRDGDLEVIPEYVTLIFESLDCIKSIVSDIEETGEESVGDDTALIQKLDAVYEGKSVSDVADAPNEAETEEAAPVEAEANAPTRDDTSSLAEGTVGIVSEADLEAAFQAAEVLPIEDLKKDLASPEESQEEKPKAAPKAAASAPAEEKSAQAKGPVSAQTLRVGVDVLEDLMTMVSELVLTRNQLLQILRTQSSSEFSAPLQRLNQIVSELQEGVMKTRMQPIGNAWSKLPRIIRDLSLELDKKIELKMEGQETELDRQVLDLIKDPLTHMVRNSADHGIEDPQDRAMAGKPEMGTITLRAFHEGGHIIIEIQDDGRGLAVNKIKAKALSNDLATEEELNEMSDTQIQRFIFKAGFSTAAEVTSVSGRGVGMDVVRTNIEKIGGMVDLVSTEGQGSTFTIKIPLTLAIVSALIVESAGQKFAMPQLTVRELVMTSTQGESQIENINGAPVFRLRDRLLPLIHLDETLKIKGEKVDDAPAAASNIIDLASSKSLPETKEEEPQQTTDTKAQYIIVSQIGDYQFGIIVDRVFDTEEIVVKPVSHAIKDIEIFSGNTILGDGSVVMILDSAGIARSSGKMDTGKVDNVDQDNADAQNSKKIPLLLFTADSGTPKAVPLSLVSRLERVNKNDIETASGEMVVQYRNQLMSLKPFAPGLEHQDKEELNVLVFVEKDNTLGLIINEILDITESVIEIKHETNQPHLMGSAIINGKTTDVVDVAHYLMNSNDHWFADHAIDQPFDGAGSSTDASSGRNKILLVDDSPFFRNMLTPLLNISGYDVTASSSASEALGLCEAEHFDLIISDIEMPEMTGFEFAEKVRANPTISNTPMVALSSHATEQDMVRGKEVGFNEYVAKFDRDKLLDTISQTLITKTGGE